MPACVNFFSISWMDFFSISWNFSRIWDMMFSLCTLLVSQKSSSLIASLALSCEFHGISTISWNCSCCLMFSLCSLLVSLFLAVADELQPQCEARACSQSLHRTTSFISKLRHVGHRTQLFAFFCRRPDVTC